MKKKRVRYYWIVFRTMKDKNVRKFLGGFFKICGCLDFAIFGFWGFILSLKTIGNVSGFAGVVIGFAVAPVTFITTPWYAGIMWSNWTPLLISYGGGIIGCLFFSIGVLITGD